MIRWSVLKRVKNYKRAGANLMYFHNWSKAVKYATINKQKKPDTPWDKIDGRKQSGPWEDAIKMRLEQMEAEQVFRVDRKW